jgi:hypothetical protein
MKLRAGMPSSRELYLITSSILRKTRDLQRGSQLARIASPQCGDHPCILVCFSALRRLIEQYLSGQNQGPNSLHAKYFRLFERTLEDIQHSVRLTRVLNGQNLARLLNHHRDLLRSVGPRHRAGAIDPATWSSFVLAAVAIWGDRI